MENLYCTIFIVDVSQNPEEVETVTSRIQQLIEDYGGIIKKINRWGKRRLAYPIDNNTYGFYVEIEFSANSHLNIPNILEQEYRINDRAIRWLTYVVDKKELIQRAKIAGKVSKRKTEVPEEVPEKQAGPAEEVEEVKEAEINEKQEEEVPEEGKAE